MKFISARSHAVFTALPVAFAAAFSAGAQEGYPLGATDAWGYVMDGDSMRVQKVRSGGPMDNSGMRARDEVIGVQVGRQFVPFRGPPKTYLRILGEGIDASMAKGGGTLSFKMRLGRDQGMVPVELPRLGAFVAGHVIDRMTVDGKENKNEFFFKGCVRYLLAKEKKGQLAAGPALAWAGLALMCSPDPSHEAVVERWVKVFETDWARENKRPTEGKGRDTFGEIINADIWGLLLMSEYNWRHPSYERRAVLEKACDELAQCLLNPSYVYKEPSWHKHDPGTEDPGNPSKEYYKDRFAYAPAARPPIENLAAAWWAWSHCAATSGVQVNPQAMEVARQYLLDLAMPADANGQRRFPKDKSGRYTFGCGRTAAAFFAHALGKSRNATEAAIGKAMLDFVNQSPPSLLGDQWEFGVLATSSLWVSQGLPAYKDRFNEWRAYMGLMMQSEGYAHYCPIGFRGNVNNIDPLVGSTNQSIPNAISLFVLAAPSRQLLMFGGKAPQAKEGYELGKTPPP